MYEQERAMVGQRYQVQKPWKVQGCKMKPGDIVRVIDYGSSSVSQYVEYKSDRLPFWTFQIGTWLFARNTTLCVEVA